jgi:hypothetical protein
MTDDRVKPVEDLGLLIEWPDQEGLVSASLNDNLSRLRDESEKAMNITIGVIHSMANKISKAIDVIEDEVRPDEMEIEFSIKLELEGGSVVPLVAKTTSGGQFNIKFKWTLEKNNRPRVLIKENS